MKAITRVMGGISDTAMNMRKITMDVLSIVTSTGKTVATLTYNGTERRDVKVITPYGVASCGTEGMKAQVVCGETINDVSVVGVYDPDKPNVGPGEHILYAGFGQRIMMLSDGEIAFINKDGNQVTLTDIYNHIHGI